jgi:hypothetical protein
MPNREPDFSSLEWAMAWERQILLETLRESPPTQEISALLERLHNREIRTIKPAFPGPPELASRAALLDPCCCEMEILRALEGEIAESIRVLTTDGLDALRDRLELLIRPDYLFRSPSGERITSHTESDFWGMWHPGLNNDDATMQEVLDTLPGVQGEAIPKEVRWFEDPTSAIALPGAVSLAWHDAIHILLGRGLLDQDEAFVVGFTMGNATSFRREDAATLRNAFSHSYPEPFRVYGIKLTAFDLGVEAGRMIGVPDLADQHGRLPPTWTLRTWRHEFGICADTLRSFYLREKLMIPGTLESARLPI